MQDSNFEEHSSHEEASNVNQASNANIVNMNDNKSTNRQSHVLKLEVDIKRAREVRERKVSLGASSISLLQRMTDLLLKKMIFPFMKLPLELRRKIYGYALPSGEKLQFINQDGHNVLQLNDEVFKEATPIYVEQNTIVPVGQDGFKLWDKWFKENSNHSSLRSVELHVTKYIGISRRLNTTIVSTFMEKFSNIDTVSISWCLVMRTKKDGPKARGVLKCLAKMQSLKVLTIIFSDYRRSGDKLDAVKEWFQTRNRGGVRVLAVGAY